MIRYDEVRIDPRSRVTRYVSMRNDIQRDGERDEDGNEETASGDPADFPPSLDS